jgi:hypothetical protein
MAMEPITVRECVIIFVILAGSAMPGLCQGSNLPPQPCALGKRNSSDQTLSGKLSRSNGVLCPPNVDPGMNAPTPNKGTMPMIPPPGSGNTQNVYPK